MKQKALFYISGFVIAVVVLVAIAAPLIAPQDPYQVFEGQLMVAPLSGAGVNGAPTFILGSDDLGRDLLSRLIYGAQNSLMIGALSTLFSLLIGGLLGLVCGYWGGSVDFVIMRLMDLLLSIPSTLLAILVVAILGPSLTNTIIAVGVVSLPFFVRVTRAQVMNEKVKDYVQASRTMGGGLVHVLSWTLFPNVWPPLLVQATLSVSDGILNAAALGFLGLGAQPPTPEWGVMLSDGRSFLESAWWLVTLPGICLLATVLCLNLFGDGLRDLLDPKARKAR